jgi:3-phosphoshikimate 1-carboxyvinyltransferase
MRETVSPARAIEGAITLPGDKSISHRYGMLSAIAEGRSVIANYSTGADCQSTLGCMRSLGAKIERDDRGRVVVEGGALHQPEVDLDAGNSGSTIRMLSGILAAQPFTARIGGDESLSRRPMARVIKPLTEMGACIEARNGSYPPLTIYGRHLRGIDYTLPVASAQVKSCVLLAGLFAEGDTIVAGVRRGYSHGKARHHAPRGCETHGPRVVRSRRSLLRLLLFGCGSDGEGSEFGDPRSGFESHPFRAPRFSGFDGRFH